MRISYLKMSNLTEFVLHSKVILTALLLINTESYSLESGSKATLVGHCWATALTLLWHCSGTALSLPRRYSSSLIRWFHKLSVPLRDTRIASKTYNLSLRNGLKIIATCDVLVIQSVTIGRPFGAGVGAGAG